MVYTVVVVFVFILTSLTFLMYDVLVERRQTTVMSSAQKSNALVSSLFPAQFRDRLLEDAAKNKNVTRKNGQNAFLAKNNYFDSSALATAAAASGDDNESVTGSLAGVLELAGNAMLNTKPLADLFPFVTVMFADIAGKWYSRKGE